MNENNKAFSEIERYEIININNGEKYGCVAENDILIDDSGYFKKLILSKSSNKFSFFGNSDFYEVDWDCVSKIGSSMIIIDADENELKLVRY